MSQENVEVVRMAVEALNRRDSDAFVGCLHPDVEWEETSDAFPGLSGSYRGPEEVRRWAEQAVVEYWAELTLEVEELTQTSDSGILLGDADIGAWRSEWRRHGDPCLASFLGHRWAHRAA